MARVHFPLCCLLLPRCAIACDMYTSAICIIFSIQCITTVLLKRKPAWFCFFGVFWQRCYQCSTSTSPPHPPNTHVGSKRGGGESKGSRAKQGDRGAGGRWDETSHTSRKGNRVKVEGECYIVTLNSAVGLETHIDTATHKCRHLHTHTGLPHDRKTHSEICGTLQWGAWEYAPISQWFIYLFRFFFFFVLFLLLKSWLNLEMQDFHVSFRVLDINALVKPVFDEIKRQVNGKNKKMS